MADTEGSQRFPFISLEKAIERAKQLYDADQRGGEMSTAGAFAVWEYSEKSSGGHQTVAALKAYGLLAAPSSGKLQLSKQALDYFRDEREQPRAKLVEQFATNAPMLRSLWNLWRSQPPGDALARSHLKVDRGLSEQSARAVLGIYKDNLAFANLKGDAKIAEVNGVIGAEKNGEAIKVGDYVQWTSGGVDQFKPVRQVTKIAGDFVWVFGSNMGIPLEQVTITSAPAPKPVMEAGAEPSERDLGPSDDAQQIDVLLRGNRLQITADVDAAGLAKLKDVLAKYDEILKLLQK